MNDVECFSFQKFNFVGIVIQNGSYQCIAIYKRVAQKISFTEREACSFFHDLICAVAIIYNIRMKCVLRVQSILLHWDFTFINSFFLSNKLVVQNFRVQTFVLLTFTMQLICSMHVCYMPKTRVGYVEFCFLICAI